MMSKKRVFVSFDYDNDNELKELLVGQAKNPDTPFELADWSIKEHLTGDWKDKAKKRIRSVDQVIVLCGESTHKANGVADELRITQEEGKDYFLLKGYKDKECTKPTSALKTDKMYTWNWDNLKALINGNR
ncbi:hypothetical protein HEQ62_10365 [Haematospirillum jordaniae]|uniref:Thoeris protein ThsB TIR-like domain-containing protein n=2 Tax=Haematospirillum jordaniae TaxID=1549855 RepID=A0A143DHC0_9PROT|nr:hypothetical protein AY555_10080 [Haematospirillum jordaniae]NKD45993.1 hypothetical protein [Haematospirillum jordaniae]NKD60174.1 hypothetical protein [Haematospirillum jordaniae]NKD68050.1 hypothetical protein [Haematospirillum jordaniae]NKD82223.1 hypothetical protein [Haematospirillum jordaniae]